MSDAARTVTFVQFVENSRAGLLVSEPARKNAHSRASIALPLKWI